MNQTCLRFLAIPHQNVQMKIRHVDNGIMCFFLPPEQSDILEIFENFARIEPAGDPEIRVVSTSDQYLIAQQLLPTR